MFKTIWCHKNVEFELFHEHFFESFLLVRLSYLGLIPENTEKFLKMLTFSGMIFQYRYFKKILSINNLISIY